MKKSLAMLAMLMVCMAAGAAAPVSVIIADGIFDEAVKQRMEQTMSALFTEAAAAMEKRRDLNYSALGITGDALTDVSMLWENSPFVCEDEQVVQHCLTTAKGYQVRNIPLELVNADEDDRYHEAVIGFDKQGRMTSFHLSISMNLYMKVLQSNIELADHRRRELILDWVEQFRTAYNQKDLNFLNAVFSSDALIITGRVVQPSTADGIPLPPKVEMFEKTKAQYMKDLARVFKKNKYIHVTFDDIEVRMHPVKENVYGVTLHQGWTSDKYHDDGFLFLLWNFTDETRPLITVRAWQPDKFEGKPLPEELKITEEDFDI